jgi:membrane associated rhomboid family serine protease
MGQQPIVTTVLIAVNVIIYLVTVIQAKSPDISAASTVFRQGALVPDLVAKGQYWRVITSGFLHLSLIHVGANMLSLYFVGFSLERVLGRGRFLAVYGLSLLGGSVLALFASSGSGIEAGASGAIFGIMGALLITFRRLRLDPRQLLIWIALNLVITFTNSGISWQAHVGGFIVGAAAGAIMVYPRQDIRKKVQLAGSAGLAILLVVLIAVFGITHKSTFCSIGYGFVNGEQGSYLTYCRDT